MRKKKLTPEFVIEAMEVHGDKYNYSEVEYENRTTDVTIICPDHGRFKQQPQNHLKGHGCPECGFQKGGRPRGTTEEFIKKAKKVHGGKYDYSEVEYVKYHTKVKIICLTHGPFEQTPANHIKGNGCPQCGIEKMRETRQEQENKKADES